MATNNAANAAIAQIIRDSEIHHAIVHGGADTQVQTDGGLVDSLAKAVAEVKTLGVAAVVDAIDETLQAGIDEAIQQAINAGLFAGRSAAVPIVQGGIVVDIANSVPRITLNNNITTVVLPTPPAAGYARVISMVFTQDATGGRTVAGWPSSLKWAGGVAPALATAANAVSIIRLLQFADGTTVGQLERGSAAGASPIIAACGDETTPLAIGTGKVVFRVAAYQLGSLRASVNIAPTGGPIVIDVKVNGSSILSTPITIPAGSKTSRSASAQPVITAPTIPDDAEVSVDVQGVGSTVAGAGLKLTMIGSYS